MSLFTHPHDVPNIFGTQMKIFLMKSKIFLSLCWATQLTLWRFKKFIMRS